MLNIAVVDKSQHEITNFRLAVILECGGSEEDLLEDKSYKQLVSIEKKAEDVFKFGARKWREARFDRLLACYHGDEVVSVCGFAEYFGSYMRVGMNYYILKKYRNSYRSLLWRKGGFVDNVFDSFLHYDGLFLTVYPHNRKLNAIARSMMTTRRHQLASAVAEADYLNRFKCSEKKYNFNSVDQFIAYCGIRRQDPNHLLSLIESRSSVSFNAEG